MADDIIVINEGYETRTSKTGKKRVVIVVKAEPLVHNFDVKELGRGVAEAIAAHFRERIKAIAATAKPATIRAREIAAKAFAGGKPWAVRRYSGGKIGAMPPNQSDRLFNDSGRMAESIVASASSDNVWRVNVAANRLDERTTKSVARIFERLAELVPEIRNPAALLESPAVASAIEVGMREAIVKLEATTKAVDIRTAKLKMQATKAALGIGKQLVRLAGTFAG
jgi:hypothetical protein